MVSSNSEKGMEPVLTEEELPLDELVKTGIAEAQASIQQPEFVSEEEDF